MANTVKLQGIFGHQAGTAVKDLKVGDVIIWNFGYKSEVVELLPSKTGKTITATQNIRELADYLHSAYGILVGYRDKWTHCNFYIAA